MCSPQLRCWRIGRESKPHALKEFNSNMVTSGHLPGPVSARLSCWQVGLISSVLSLTIGCSVVVDANRAQCKRDSDCSARGAAFAASVCVSNVCMADPQWACVDEPPPPDATGTYQVTLHVRDVVASAPLAGVDAQLCRKLDLDCERPLARAVSDETGKFVLPVSGNFDGYVQMKNDVIAPSLYFFNPPVSADEDLPPISLASPQVAAGISLRAGGALLADHGIMLLTTTDCLKQPAANISYSIGGVRDPATFMFYLVGGLPTNNISVTDATGYGGLVNLPPGVTTVTALLAPDQRKVGTISVLARAGYVTYSQIYAGAM
jgi:hypothetical protein